MTVAYLILCGLALVLPASYQAVAYLCALVFVVADPEAIPAYHLSGGGAVMAGDIVLLAMLARSVCFGANRLPRLVRTPGFWAPAVLVAGYLGTTVVGGSEFGQRHLMACLVSLARSTSALLLGYSLALGLPDRKSIRRSSYLIIAFILANAGFVYFNYVGSRFGVTIGEVQGLERGEPRYFGPIGDGVGLVLALGFFVVLFRRSVLFMMVFGGAILMTGTIGAVITLGVGFVVWTLFRRKLAPLVADVGIGRLLLFIGGAGAVACLMFLAAGTGDILQQRMQSGGVGQSVAQRLWSFGLAFDIIRDNPVFGVGYQGFGDIYANSGATGFDEAKGDVANANNQILQVMADGGIAMLAVFAWFSVKMINVLRRATLVAEDRALVFFFGGALVWFLALLIGNQSATWLIPGAVPTMIVWVVFGHAIAMINLAPVGAAAIPRLEYPSSQSINACRLLVNPRSVRSQQ